MKKIVQFLLFLLLSGLGSAQNSSLSYKTTALQLGFVETIASKELSENRVINIYLPQGYNADSAATYPVIYLLDGATDEDFIPVAGLVHSFSFPWIGVLPPSILVGIANVDRKRDFLFPSNSEMDKKEFPTSGGADKFTAFIEKEVQPLINSKYKTNKSQTIIGQSLGGLLTASILLMKPQLFDTYIIVSPSLWWSDGSLVTQQGSSKEIDKLKFLPGTKIYIGVGKEGTMKGREKWDMASTAKLLADNLQKSNNKNIHTFFDYLPNETHATAGLPAVYNAFKLLNGKNK